jgi:murein DD-endopeptidase MepM/ murein hydrolase activator NlpD
MNDCFVGRTLGRLLSHKLSCKTVGQSSFKLQNWRRVAIVAIALLITLAIGLSLTLAQPALGQSAQPNPAASPSAAEDLETLKRQTEEIDRYKSSLETQEKQINSAEAFIQGNMTDLQQSLKTTQSTIQDNRDRLRLAQQYLTALEADLVKSQTRYDRRQSATVARLRFFQQQQRLKGLALLLKSQNLNEFLERRYRLKRLYLADRQGLGTLKAEADRLETRRSYIQQQKNGMALLAQKLDLEKSKLETQVQTQRGLAKQLKDDRQALEAAQLQLKRDSDAIKAVIQDKTAQLERDRQLASLGISGKGPLRVPVDAPITSEFGWRIHPVLGTERFHSGMDFGADYGAAIIAAGPGIVILADWYGGYGNAVILDHGNGITTLYGHGSELLVQTGQAVALGQPIATVGSTGLSTGPHLHFEVRQEGEPVDPRNYL